MPPIENCFRNIGEEEGLPEMSQSIRVVWRCKEEDPIRLSWIIWEVQHMSEFWDIQNYN